MKLSNGSLAGWAVTLFLLACLNVQAGFELPELPYAYDALEPHIDALTMEIHHQRHHQSYVDNLNAQIDHFPELEGMSLELMMSQVSRFNMAVRNNGGGHYNHALFWQVMAPAGNTGEPSDALRARIEKDFGSMDAMQEAFNAAAATRFGSGWVWIIVTGGGELAVTSTANQDNPLMDVEEVRGVPILCLDVWEHAYYLQYRNRRMSYVEAWWYVVNWHEVNRRFAALMD